MLSILREMKDAGMSNWAIAGEVAGAVCVFAIPLLFLFIGHAFGLK